MTYSPFVLDSLEKTELYEKRLHEYVLLRSGFVPGHISLSAVYMKLSNHTNFRKIFAAFFDIQLNFYMLYMDSQFVGAIWNKYYAKGDLDGIEALDSIKSFSTKMDTHYFNTSFIFRYRALWDKLMGLVILLHAPTEYDKFMKGSKKSRKPSFLNISKKNTQVNKAICCLSEVSSVDELMDYLTEFDNKFRTPEAHGTGALRKASLSTTPCREGTIFEQINSLRDSPQFSFGSYLNKVVRFLSNASKCYVIGKEGST